jgi:putative SOS response-associated peptidase YedK
MIGDAGALAFRCNEPVAFVGIWRPWTGTRGTKAEPVTGEHKLFAILTTEANELVRPIHSKAMPVLLSGEERQKAWLTMPVEEALAVQRNVLQPERMRVA